MDATQNSRLTMFNAVARLLDDSTAIIAPLPALTAAVTELHTLLDNIAGLVATQAQPTSGATFDKSSALDAMADSTLSVANSVKGYASKNRLGDLAAKVASSRTTLTTGRELNRVTQAQQVHDAANGVLAHLADYGVSAADLTTLQAKIDAARAALSAPRNLNNAKKSATERMPVAFRQVDSLLRHQIDPLVAKLASTQPNFYARYQAARIVVDRPGSHPPSAAAPAPAAPTAAK